MKRHSKSKSLWKSRANRVDCIKIVCEKNKNNVYKKIDGIMKKQRELQKNDL